MSDEHSVDFLQQKYDFTPSQKKTKKSKVWLKVLGLLLGITAIAGVAFSYSLSSEYNEDSGEYETFSIFSSLRTLVGADEKALTGEDDDRINFLFLGVGGDGHAGPELSDSIIFVSYRPSTGDVGMLSIPRDLVVPIPGYGYRKINHINAYGELEEEDYGAVWASEIIGDLLGQEIHYYVKADFNGFEDLINEIGGVNVYVETSFTDNTYPTEDDLIQTISFEEGWQMMDGETSLMFARSRHGSNGEGSDFARSDRQQKILVAIKDKLLSASTFLNPAKLNQLINTFQENVNTNLTFWEIMKLARDASDIDMSKITMTVLEPSDESSLYSTTINGAYVILPKRDDWSPIQQIAANILDSTDISNIAELNPSPESSLSATVEIQNGTSVSGLAFQASQLLSGPNFEVVTIGNADSKDYATTIIYDLTEGEKTEELAALKEFLEADVAMSPAGWIFSDDVVPRELTVETPQETDSEVDFLIILGENAESLVLR
ncbi:hypothetical protein CO057_02950 [Candidatus Uhrbacteria bacterium CG_4_9_14_0_2_um_filter_41_50]|uniref:Cell envelope-related transcriptional attenuator domain-containing protein n=1 Tax=Candidatus Uhrbacteria bacterium CG_4_9_14_0_2_um_filter_41_50 TaxID=1975031 RepID=A0A2M8ENR7_9BACT|nr:MAG: hypothetical protein COZ45_00800 [Candidatus Uhrbacteria bacterium CG_4_10_14_3_um_filter_41_21]PIZ54813.1 MAG: hypothetical protein COY24_02490 [Candidatus Uhrbacteria bacterium CG_4_10_14_0_2_um_filter_41_21]PJB84606.1 MAG: hypothetical protein CO086_02770 [Candidatus Uhrbacteria bacterium CG_4_9_14_0_8_um_filter_41_16]PJC24402.1 MAG: hypothetical protein CO057_02950 [Candidatus Uhrbacteria bacterium CG_4_9_14_0_2_um_filter_41_50]PJE75163.1 MAG: hypothetical protein COV03_01655 [Candi